MANRDKFYNENRRSKKQTSRAGQFRIIGGQWKGRKLKFFEVEGLRPSLDRVRETLFNWLQGEIHGARCLDLFAGSGALGIEALSRGAAFVQFVELNKKASRQLETNLGLLDADNDRLFHGDAFEFIAANQDGFDLVLLDPPFHKGIAQSAVDALTEAEWLEPGTLIYIEVEQGVELQTPAHWQLLKDKKTGQLLYKLYRVESV